MPKCPAGWIGCLPPTDRFVVQFVFRSSLFGLFMCWFHNMVSVFFVGGRFTRTADRRRDPHLLSPAEQAQAGHNPLAKPPVKCPELECTSDVQLLGIQNPSFVRDASAVGHSPRHNARVGADSPDHRTTHCPSATVRLRLGRFSGEHPTPWGRRVGWGQIVLELRSPTSQEVSQSPRTFFFVVVQGPKCTAEP